MRQWGISEERIKEVLKPKVEEFIKEDTTTSVVLEKLELNEELSLTEKIYAAFVIGKMYEKSHLTDLLMKRIKDGDRA